jgi:hypothetical protein
LIVPIERLVPLVDRSTDSEARRAHLAREIVRAPVNRRLNDK